MIGQTKLFNLGKVRGLLDGELFVAYWLLTGSVISWISKQDSLVSKVTQKTSELHGWNAGGKSNNKVRGCPENLNDEVFWFQYSSQRTERLDITPFGALVQLGPYGPRLRGRKISKCTRLANVKSVYDPRTKEKLWWLRLFKSVLCQPRGRRTK